MPLYFTRAALLAVIAGMPVVGAFAAPAAYTITPVPGVAYNDAVVINRWGQVAGVGVTVPGPVLWTPSIANGATGILLGLATQAGYPANAQPGFPGSVAAMNDRGQVTGSAVVSSGGDDNGTVTYLWTPKTLNSTSGKLHGGKGLVTAFAQVNAGSFALAPYPRSINNLGQITAGGAYYVPELFTPTAANTGTGTWSFDNTTSSSNFYINDAGVVAGSVYGGAIADNGHNHAFEQAGFPPFNPASLLTDPIWQPFTNSAVLGLNQAGDAIVSAVPTTENALHAYLSKAGTISDIGGGFSATPVAINDSDMVVGGRVENGGEIPYLFTNGTALDLPGLVPATVGGHPFSMNAFPAGINTSGQILVTGGDTVGDGVFILTPAAQIIGAQPKVANGAIHPAGSLMFKRTVTVTNTTGAALAGPVSVAFDALPTGVVPATGGQVTQFAGPAGSPVVDVAAGGLAPSASAAITVLFSAPSAASITYTTRVLAGPAPR